MEGKVGRHAHMYMEGGGHATPVGMTAAAPAAMATANKHEQRPSERDQVAGTSPNEHK